MTEHGHARVEAARERAAARLRQRLWGATVLIALAVVVLPLLLDGAGSESRFRRVEKLREEPPRLVGTERADRPARFAADGGARASDPGAEPRAAPVAAPEPRGAPPVASARPDPAGLPRAWVVQAGSFRDRSNALAVLDTLRRAGHPAFVTDAGERGAPLYRVRVGPLVDAPSAGRLRDAVVALLGRNAIVVAYP